MTEQVTGVAVAVAVENLATAVERYRAAFALGEPQYATSETDAVEVAMFPFEGSWLQLVAPTSDESVIAKHLQANGPGLHHFGFVVESVDATLQHIRDAGLRTLDDAGRRLLRCSTEGVVNDLPFPFADEEITPESVASGLAAGEAAWSPIAHDPTTELRRVQITSALGPVISGEGALARLSFHSGYHQGQAYQIKCAPGFPQ